MGLKAGKASNGTGVFVNLVKVVEATDLSGQALYGDPEKKCEIGCEVVLAGERGNPRKLKLGGTYERGPANEIKAWGSARSLQRLIQKLGLGDVEMGEEGEFPMGFLESFIGKELKVVVYPYRYDDNGRPARAMNKDVYGPNETDESILQQFFKGVERGWPRDYVGAAPALPVNGQADPF